MVGDTSSVSAATAAASGAAALVPKKLGRPSPSKSCPGKKKVVLPPSGAVNRGDWRVTWAPSRLPSLSNRIGVPPTEENDSICGGLTPNAGVKEYRAAPTPAAPAALG